MSPENQRAVAVVGSANLDVVVAVERFPAPGETVLGGEVQEVAGGKGLNQAASAARVVPTALVACVGDDSAGRLLLDRLHRADVDTRHVRLRPTPTGRAYIQVAADGENSIVVAAGANSLVTPNLVERALYELRPKVVLSQLEVPLEAVEAAATWTRTHGARFVLNPSPIRDLPAWLLSLCDPLVVNTTEAMQLLDSPHGTPPDDLARGLCLRARSTVVTDGPRGAWIGTAEDVRHSAVPPVVAVDTTGAGDEFAGRLAADLAQGVDLFRAGENAAAAAARLVSVARDRR